MTLDSTTSPTTAKGPVATLLATSNTPQKGTNTSASNNAFGAAIEKCPKTNDIQRTNAAAVVTSWCYLYVHNRKVPLVEKRLHQARLRYFIHKSIKYVQRRGEHHGFEKLNVPTVSGLVFMQGAAQPLQNFLNEALPGYRLCKNCSTGQVAVIANAQMEPFMRVAEADPDCIRFLLRPFEYYAQNRTLLRITSGPMAGLEGYVIRIARDRRLVMDVGGISIAVSGVHAERFEEVDKNKPTNKRSAQQFPQRTLQERNAFIDRYFHPVRTMAEVGAQTDNIHLLQSQIMSDLSAGRINLQEAYETLRFVIDEVGYYYAPLVDQFGTELRPIFRAAAEVMQSIAQIINTLPSMSNQRQRYEAERDEMMTNYSYLFDE